MNFEIVYVFSQNCISSHFKPNMSDTKPEAVNTAPAPEPQPEGKGKVEGFKPIDDTGNISDDDNCKEKESGVSAALEPCTLPWPGDRKPQAEQEDDGIWSEKCTSEPEDGDTGISRGSQDISEKQSQEEEEGGTRNKSKWRESMPEGERWQSDEIKGQSEKNLSQVSDQSFAVSFRNVLEVKENTSCTSLQSTIFKT